MAAYVNVKSGRIEHVHEGTWQQDYMEEGQTGIWRQATEAEVAAVANAGVYVPPADDPDPEPVKAVKAVKPKAE